MKQPPSHVVLSLLSGAATYFAFDLVRSGRAPLAWPLPALLGLALLWDLICLARRLHAAGGGRALWHLLRTLLFWGAGLSDTVLIRPERVGTWHHAAGWVLLALATLDTAALYRRERPPAAPTGSGSA